MRTRPARRTSAPATTFWLSCSSPSRSSSRACPPSSDRSASRRSSLHWAGWSSSAPPCGSPRFPSPCRSDGKVGSPRSPGHGPVPDGPGSGRDERRHLPARRRLRHNGDDDSGGHRLLRPGDGGTDADRRQLGDLWGRRRAFTIGLCIYAVGSALTAASWSVPTLMLGWSILEGVGAALVLPALVALVAGTYEGRERSLAYGVLGGVAGAGIAVGPILGGWVTTEFTWRLVFVGEVVVTIGILAGTRLIREPARDQSAPRLDWVGGGLSALGLSLMVLGVLQASNWGWLQPRSSPIEPFGFSLTPS